MAADDDKTRLRGVAEEPTLIRPRPLPEDPAEDEPPDDATVFRPMAAPAPGYTPARIARFPQGGLLEEAAELLQIAADLAQTRAEPALDALHADLLGRLRGFRRRAEATAEAPWVAERAAYLLGAFLDETVLNTPWGERSDWSRRSLLRLCHGETWGGERVFDDIARAREASAQGRAYLQLAYRCLALGFQGKYRVRERGRAELDALRDALYRELRGAAPADGKAAEQPTAAAGAHARRLGFKAVLTLSALILGLIVATTYGFLRMDLGRESGRLQARLAALVPPPAKAELPDGSASAPTQPPGLALLRRQLAPEIARGVLAVEPLGEGVAVVLRAPELFGSASAELAPAYYPVLDKLGHALAAVPGQVVVAGHTDNQAIRSTRYPSNWHLSLARAAAVANYLGREAQLAGRLLPEGRADTQPVADNQSREGRARNRRVTLELTPWKKALIDGPGGKPGRARTPR
ncbi:type VI secretion system protein TssL, long form [Alkalilimnicola sp. S0819]|uniref:type VI secretion system protein TssL, long form n=1 Tax=Alkalilimnicola sp. S0819 TaxID=2613922 RepID=UPI001261ACE8|nr:type VI secretion system protein TssL, long form [Alkalilimnicola sp. S0819]KAB7622617.1 type VI secretion system protein TssL [Alkalilimnicola sp. S0819]MPQ17388.1 type VI secretion system protein TssL [Alkalilimnicola sp. S0819]